MKKNAWNYSVFLLGLLSIISCSQMDDIKPSRFWLNRYDIELPIGEYFNLEAREDPPASNNAVWQWTSSNSGCVEMAGYGFKGYGLLLQGKKAGTTTITARFYYRQAVISTIECIVTVPVPFEYDTDTFGTYDLWSYSEAGGWLKVQNQQLVLSRESLNMASIAVFPSNNPYFEAQKLFVKDGQIWMTYKVNDQLQTLFLYDYFLEDSTRYGARVLWIKSNSSSSATVTTAPDPSSAGTSQLLMYVPVGESPS
jgi:hypothetical protein